MRVFDCLHLYWFYYFPGNALVVFCNCVISLNCWWLQFNHYVVCIFVCLSISVCILFFTCVWLFIFILFIFSLLSYLQPILLFLILWC